jgi:hypothetical protein
MAVWIKYRVIITVVNLECCCYFNLVGPRDHDRGDWACLPILPAPHFLMDTVCGKVYAPRGGPLLKNTVVATLEKRVNIRTDCMCRIYVTIHANITMYVNMCEKCAYRIMRNMSEPSITCHAMCRISYVVLLITKLRVSNILPKVVHKPFQVGYGPIFEDGLISACQAKDYNRPPAKPARNPL